MATRTETRRMYSYHTETCENRQNTIFGKAATKNFAIDLICVCGLRRQAAYSSDGRAGDCSMKTEISRSLVRIRLGGTFSKLRRCNAHVLTTLIHVVEAPILCCTFHGWV